MKKALIFLMISLVLVWPIPIEASGRTFYDRRGRAYNLKKYYSSYGKSYYKKVYIKQLFYREVLPLYFVSYNPTIRPAAVIINPPEIRVAPTQVSVVNPSVTIEQRRALVQQERVAVDPRAVQDPRSCEQALAQFRAENLRLRQDLDMCLKKLNLSSKPDDGEYVPKAKTGYPSFLKSSCITCHGAAPVANDYSLFTDKGEIITPQGREKDVFFSKIVRGTMPKQPNKHNIKPLTDDQRMEVIDWLEKGNVPNKKNNEPKRKEKK